MTQEVNTEHRDDVGARLGMWIFIFTELLLFGGLFLVYSVFRRQYPIAFHEAAMELDALIGTINTIILLVSSMSVAMAVTAIQKNEVKRCGRLMLLTIFLGLIFLVNKYFEWGHKFEHGIYPSSKVLLGLEKGHIMYFGLYYFMTGLHAFHIIVGLIFLWIVYRRVVTAKVNSEDHVVLENSALYWHLVDLIWIFLFPLLYLIS